MTIMKKIKLLVVLTLLFSVISCENEKILDTKSSNSEKLFTKNNSNEEEEYLANFYNSNTYKSLDFSTWLKTENYTIFAERIVYTKNDLGDDVPVVNIAIQNENNKVIGFIEAVSYINQEGIIDFNILLRNFSSYDFENQTGIITLIDVNEKLEYLSTEIIDGVIIEVNPNIEFTNINSSSKRHPMDKNGDGNVTFSECYAYTNAACQTDPECYTLCYLGGDAIGWVVTGAGPLCQYAISSACVVTAWNN